MVVSDTETGFKVESEHGSVEMAIQGENAFGHGWHYEGDDIEGAAALLLTARTELKKRGFDRFMIHIPFGENGLGEFWVKLGAMPLFMAMEVRI